MSHIDVLLLTPSQKSIPDALLKVEAFTQEQHALVSHLLQLLLQPQVILDLLPGVVVTHACCTQHLLQTLQCLRAGRQR